MTRILPEIKKNIAIINEFPEKLFAMISDEWLASLWHANANRGGEFGNQKWDYYVFEPAEKLGENLFTCLLPDGTPIVVYSPAVQEVFDKDAMSCLCVLVEMGGWFVVYGAILWWQGIRTKDFETLAKTVAPQMYDAKGLTGVIHFNPVPFWIAYKSASIPPVAHKGKIVIRCIAETRFSKEGVQKVLKTWKHESAGKYERWILNDEDYLGSATVYLDVKTKAVIIVSFDEELFEQVLEQISDYIDHKHFTEERVSMIMATYLKDKSRKYALLNKCEKIFEKH